MLKKRISAALVVKDGLVVQSFGFSRHLPVGKIAPAVRNLANWKVDEIIILNISAAAENTIDLELIGTASEHCQGTPLVYGGGICNAKDAANAVRNGADRLVIGAAFLEGKCTPRTISEAVGAQAVVMSLPLVQREKELFVFNHVDGSYLPVVATQELFSDPDVSEVLLTDVANVGRLNWGFALADSRREYFDGISQILYGGIVATNINALLSEENVVSVAIGNVLQHRELSYWQVKHSLTPPDDSFPRQINVM